MFRIEEHLIWDHLRETSLRELEVLRILLTSLKVIKSSREESSSMVTVVAHR